LPNFFDPARERTIGWKNPANIFSSFAVADVLSSLAQASAHCHQRKLPTTFSDPTSTPS
jgi:hypothetical protein